MSRKAKQIVTDIDTLKEVLGKQSASWWHKSLSTLLVGNIGMMITISWALITDHFTTKTLVNIAEIHTKEIITIKSDVGSLKDRVIIHGEKIKNLEDKKR